MLKGKKFFWFDPGLFKNSSESAFRHITWMIWNGSVEVFNGVESNFMTAGGLAIEGKSENFEASYNFPIFKSGQSTHQAFTIRG